MARRCHCREILAVKGSPDSGKAFRAPIRDLHTKTFQFRGLGLGGFGGAWKYRSEGNYLFEQEEVERHLAEFPPVDFFVAHNSPRGIHDTEDGTHPGFTAFNSYITRSRPRFFFHGHQHHEIETDVGGTRVICVYSCRYLAIPDQTGGPAPAPRARRFSEERPVRQIPLSGPRLSR